MLGIHAPTSRILYTTSVCNTAWFHEKFCRLMPLCNVVLQQKRLSSGDTRAWQETNPSIPWCGCHSAYSEMLPLVLSPRWASPSQGHRLTKWYLPFYFSGSWRRNNSPPVCYSALRLSAFAHGNIDERLASPSARTFKLVNVCGDGLKVIVPLMDWGTELVTEHNLCIAKSPGPRKPFERNGSSSKFLVLALDEVLPSLTLHQQTDLTELC